MVVRQVDIPAIDERTAYLKTGQRANYLRVAAKKKPAFKVGRSWRFRATAIDGWIADHSKWVEDKE